ncbi:CAP domain-containing protein [Kribbella voronezhensis]|uniref:CAP domain-containing protein n=1 Tax=Kribbella voronezhensis TaxID=2512212 RepID=UPI001EE1099B|nr:hypothetical protein [Kribbella voronezhensis]
MKRTLVAIGTVILVITPISWILLHEPQSDQADASIPYVTRDDDTYITASNEPVVHTSDTPSPSTPTPPATPTKPTRTPSATPTPGDDPTRTPSTHPTTVPTNGPGDQASTPPVEPTRGGDSHSTTPTPVPSKTTTQPPADDGSMTADEQQLFSLIDDARVQNGCAPLARDSNLTGNARNEAVDRADTGDVSSTEQSKASAGGEDMSAQAAFDRLKSRSSSTLLNCGLRELGVGRDTAKYQTCFLLFCSNHTRVAWVADFQ